MLILHLRWGGWVSNYVWLCILVVVIAEWCLGVVEGVIMMIGVVVICEG